MTLLFELDTCLTLEILGSRCVAVLKWKFTLDSFLCPMVSVSNVLDKLGFESAEPGVDYGLTLDLTQQRVVKFLHLVDPD